MSILSIFSKLFGSKKKDFTYTGQKPFNTQLQAKGGQEYYDTITNRLQGRNVGFGPDYASKYANPIIQNSRAQFTDYTLPELQSELSATGRRRGSGGFSQIAQAYKEQGNQENDVFSRLQQRNEDQMRNEINDALGRTGQFAKDEAALQDRYANFDYNNIYAPQVQREQQRMANEAAGLNNLVYAGTDLLSNFLGGDGGVAQRTGSNFYQPVGVYPSAPPPNYNYSNISSRNVSGLAKRARI